MDFKWNLNHYITKNIVKIDNSLIPEGFSGDRLITRACIEAISEVIDQLGVASAKAQGLKQPITTAERHRLSDYELYLLFDSDGNMGNGTVVGMLKMGKKKLYVFNYNGDCHDKVCLCVLDFYVHESRQRQGCGKQLFDHMLNLEDISPEKIAIDRPSEKFLSFLLRHYGLKHVIPQNNNFVVFQGFFPSTPIIKATRLTMDVTRPINPNPQ